MELESDAFQDVDASLFRDREFQLFRELIYAKSGIFLGPYKRTRMFWKLGRRMREVGVDTFRDYYDYVLERGEPEIHSLLESICTHETRFFREPVQMQYFSEQVIPELQREKGEHRNVKIWSAGCSSGEEPYSLAMLLLDRLPVAQRWQHSVWATDLSRPVLQKAREGLWAIEKSQEIPFSLLQTYMLRGIGSHQGLFTAGRELRSVITFDVLNLNDEVYPVTEPFDVIFCRNVLIYFSTESRARVVDRLLRHLVPGGFLFLGHTKTLQQHPRVTRSPVPAVYRVLRG